MKSEDEIKQRLGNYEQEFDVGKYVSGKVKHAEINAKIEALKWVLYE